MIKLAIGVTVAWTAWLWGLGWLGETWLAPVLGSGQVAGLLLMGLGLPLGALGLATLGRRWGLGANQWDYHWSLGAITAGLAGGVLYLGLLPLLSGLGLKGLPLALPDLPISARPAGSLGFLVIAVNGGLAAWCDEWMWRGMVQSALTRVATMTVGLLGTMAVFSLSQALISGVSNQWFDWLVLGFFLGALRVRWGTSSSTVARILINTVAATSLGTTG
ncbi:MAG: CPBP family intramembrane metalloprotease [Gloeomargaritaceae cyanobacterium C42_A2020_066]|nr:CPBP family intramembrane metalloprotease [Gloeomargaritaceae cyanobacterium C42_A2020_066]